MNNLIHHDPLVNEFCDQQLVNYEKALPLILQQPTITGDKLAKSLGISPSYGSKILRAARRTLGIHCTVGSNRTIIGDLERFRRVAAVLNSAETSSAEPVKVTTTESTSPEASPVRNTYSMKELTSMLLDAVAETGIKSLELSQNGYTLTIDKN